MMAEGWAVNSHLCSIGTGYRHPLCLSLCLTLHFARDLYQRLSLRSLTPLLLSIHINGFNSVTGNLALLGTQPRVTPAHRTQHNFFFAHMHGKELWLAMLERLSVCTVGVCECPLLDFLKAFFRYWLLYTINIDVITKVSLINQLW